MSHDKNQSVEDEHIDSATPTPSPLEQVKQHQAEMQQSLQQHSDDAEERVSEANAQVPGQGVPSDIRHHPQRNNSSHNR